MLDFFSTVDPGKLTDGLIVTEPFSHRQDVVSLMVQRVVSTIIHFRVCLIRIVVFFGHKNNHSAL